MKSEAGSKSIAYGALACACLCVFCLILFGQVRYTESDPRGWLMVSESLLTHGTLKLDHYGADLLRTYGYAVTQTNGHFYHYFPLGTPLASLPFVAIAHVFGMDMRADDGQMQILIAASVNVLLCLTMFRIARLWLSVWPALVATFLFWAGSSYASTGGTALWSHDFATLFATLAIYFALRFAQLGETGWWPAIGALIFAAYFTRPPLSLMAPCLLLFMLAYHRLQAVLAGAVTVLLLGLFVAFSWHEFGQILPDYYLPKRLEGGAFWTALQANLVSPARGLLVFSPFLLTVWFCRPLAAKGWGLKPAWLLVGLVWPLAQLVMISRFPIWWSGFAFGPRFMTDALPGLYLLTLAAWPARWPRRGEWAPAGLFALSLFFSVAVNTGQGLYNRFGLEWNLDPNVDTFPELVFDWRYPQFAATRDGHQRRLIRLGLPNLTAIAPGEVIDHASDRVIWVGWSSAEPQIRWSNADKVRIVFKLPEPLPAMRGHLVLRTATLRSQRVTLRLNGRQIYAGTLAGEDVQVPVDLPPDTLRPGRNDLEFLLPDAQQPGTSDQRHLALALRSLRID